MAEIVRWNTSLAELIPKGNLLKQNRPNGVTNVVYSLESSLSGICQKSILASSFVNTFDPPSLAKLSSTGVDFPLYRCVELGEVDAYADRSVGFGDYHDP